MSKSEDKSSFTREEKHSLNKAHVLRDDKALYRHQNNPLFIGLIMTGVIGVLGFVSLWALKDAFLEYTWIFALGGAVIGLAVLAGAVHNHRMNERMRKMMDE